MPISGPRLALLAAASVAAGLIAATAEGEGATSPKLPPPVTAVAPAPTAPACAPSTPPADAKPPSEALIRSFGILRRERTAADELPAALLDTLRARGLAPRDPTAARLLRTTPEGGRAWVVPVPDADSISAIFPCEVPGRAPRVPRPAIPPVTKAVPPAPRLAVPPTGAAPRPSHPPVTRAVPRRVVPRPAIRRGGRAPIFPAAAPPRGPREGLAVVAIGGAPSGGGGAGRDLVRGLAPPAVDPCAGPARRMQAISGIVPDRVDAVFLTSENGTAIRTEVKDNGWSFVVPRVRRPERRYVVWTGADGTPHVQPVVTRSFGRRMCAKPPKSVRARDVPVISPNPFVMPMLLDVMPARPPGPRRP